MQLRRATRQQAKLRIGLSAPSGFGKTYSALLLAFGITQDWAKIAVIDTENGSAELYAHLGEYNALPLEAPYSPERYIQAIRTCEEAGMEVIIIDSISHEWEGAGGCLEIYEKLGGKYQDWAKVTPRHQAFISSITSSKSHIITTVRRKQDYDMVKEGNKTTVVKTGLKEVTREGFEYELTLNLEIINDKHLAKASKDRTSLFMDKPEFVITAETGRLLKKWAETGVDAAKMEQEAREKAQAQAEAEGLELDDKRKELTAMVDANLACFGPENSTKTKQAIAKMSIDKYQEFKNRINNQIQSCENERLSKAEKLHDLVTENSDAIGDESVSYYLNICQGGTLPEVRQALEEIEHKLNIPKEEQPVVKYATALHKEKIIKLLNNPVITRQEKTRELLRINKHTYDEAEKLIKSLRKMIEDREQENSAAA